MKGLIIFITSLLLAIAAMGQGNLQFNQVKYINLSYVLPNGNSYQTYDQVITVPAGKVWKIESAIGSNKSNSTSYVSPTTSVTLDGGILSFYSSSTGNYQAAAFPIWLPEGSYTLGLISAGSSFTGSTIIGRVSLIEFNVIP